MHRFYVAPEYIQTGMITLPESEARHAYAVLRLRRDDAVNVFDGEGGEYSGVISDLSARQGRVTIKNTRRYEPPAVHVTLAAAIPKQSRFDEIVDSATQLGVRTLIPLISERTVAISAGDTAQHKQRRWQKIAVEAAKQCGCMYLPRVQAVEKFSTIVAEAGSYDLALIPALCAGAVPLKKILRAAAGPEKIIVFIGPEGDFSPAEIALGKENKCRVVSLGKQVLRCATAAAMVLAVMRYEWEN